jgi:hypothetical protein
VKKNYQRKERKSNHKFEVVRGQELLVRVPLPMAEVWAEMQQFPFAWEFFYAFGRAAIRLIVNLRLPPATTGAFAAFSVQSTKPLPVNLFR